MRRLAACGWRALEFSDEHWRELDAREDPEQHFRAMRTLFDDLGLHVPQMHGPMFNVCGPPEEVRPNMELARRAVRWAGVLGIERYVFHPGSSPWAEEEAAWARVREQNAQHIGSLAECGREGGVKIAVENTCDGPSKGRREFGAIPAELLWIVRHTDAQRVGICWDTGHACIQQLDQAQALAALGPHLIATHVQDNDGRSDQHLLPFEGTIDWANLMGGLRAIGWEGLFNLEVPGAFGRVPLPAREAKLRYALELTEALVEGRVP